MDGLTILGAILFGPALAYLLFLVRCRKEDPTTGEMVNPSGWKLTGAISWWCVITLIWALTGTSGA